ncbi:MAG: Ig-like domain-containing protein [Gammaproteobacteria bacterium]|nr:Ig-like domain-containing protein [Gammaproteobacteria bacterium]
MRVRFLPFFLLAWLALCGSSFVSCSSSSGDGIIDPRPDNRAPRALDSSTAATVNMPLSSFMQAVDDDGDRLFYRLVTAPSLGSIRLDNTATGAFTYTGNATGTDHFSFQVDDGLANSNIATVTIQVVPTALANADRAQLRNRL